MSDIKNTTDSEKTTSDNFVEKTGTSPEDNPNQVEKTEDLTKMDFIEVKAPKYYIGDYPIDRATIKTHLPGMLIWIFVWFALGFHRVKCKLLNVFFIGSCLFWLIQIHNRRFETQQHIDDEWDTLMQMREMCLIMFSISIMFTVFFRNIKPDATQEDYLILAVMNMFFIFGVFWYNLEDTSEIMREVRNIHNSVYMIGLLIMMAFILKTFVCPEISVIRGGSKEK